LNEKEMHLAIKLAMKGSGRVSPNPRVGAVILKDGKIAGKGWHKEFGGSHAEVNAINNSKLNDFTGCTIIVTLEPCSHYGKTSPCAELIIQKNFKKVVIGMIDPNPLVSGKGIEMLKSSGIEVIHGILEEDCFWLNRFFIKHVTAKLPYVIVKIAQSINGNIATITNESKWISGEESRKRTHALRAEVDAVLIGKNTALNDNPELTVRCVKGENPKRIVLDTKLSLPTNLKIFSDDFRSKTIVCTNLRASLSEKAEILQKKGITILPVEEVDKKLNIKNAIEKLSEKLNITSILVEGGAGIYSQFAKLNLIDEIQIFQAPIIIGNGINAFGNFTTNILSDSERFKTKSVTKCGNDIHTIFIKK